MPPWPRSKAHHVDQPNDRQLARLAVHGLLKQLDPYSTLLDPQSFRDMQEEARGIFGGLGIEVTESEGLVKVVAPAVGSHAARAGIRAGDVITQIDHAAIRNIPITQVVERMRGPVHSSVLLRIQRGAAAIDLRIERDLIRVRSVAARREGDDVGYIQISKFNELTFAAVREAIERFSSELPGNRLKGYILDLRNNPGGLVEQAVLVAGVFLGEGDIVSTRGRHATKVYHLKPNTAQRGLIGNKPIIVLINGGTASAAEIVAGALQDHKRATLVGSRSFGKGSVQTVVSLGSGKGALKLTTAWYFTPTGRSIQDTGIAPDIEVFRTPHRLAKVGPGKLRKADRECDNLWSHPTPKTT